MSRADTRAYNSMRERFKRKAGGSLITAFIPAGTPLDQRDQYGAVFSRALADWLRSPAGYRCFCCQIDGKAPGAILYSAAAVRPSTASLSICCFECSKRTLVEIESAAERVLQQIIPGGRFEPLPADTS